jgi:phosphoserine phosphatase
MKKPCVFFDLDGTFLRWQHCHAFIVALVHAGLIENVVLQRLEKAFTAYKKRQGEFGDFANEMVAGLFSEDRLCGVRVSDMEHVCKRLAQESGDYVHIFTRELNIAARELGYERAIITGSPTVSAEAFAEHHDIPIVLGTDFPNDGERYIKGNVFDWVDKKDEAIQELANKYNLDLTESVAVGDSESDTRMLGRVRYPIAFNPNSGLYRAAAAYDWPIVTERKLVYALSWMNGVGLAQAELAKILPQKLGTRLKERLEALNVYP